MPLPELFIVFHNTWLFLLFLFFQGSDESFLQKINSQHGKSSCFVKSKSLSRASFGVVHFAGTIHYDVRGKLWHAQVYFSVCVAPICSTKLVLRAFVLLYQRSRNEGLLRLAQPSNEKKTVFIVLNVGRVRSVIWKQPRYQGFFLPPQFKREKPWVDMKVCETAFWRELHTRRTFYHWKIETKARP